MSIKEQDNEANRQWLSETYGFENDAKYSIKKDIGKPSRSEEQV